jgi:hypothetical protein
VEGTVPDEELRRKHALLKFNAKVPCIFVERIFVYHAIYSTRRGGWPGTKYRNVRVQALELALPKGIEHPSYLIGSQF